MGFDCVNINSLFFKIISGASTRDSFLKPEDLPLTSDAFAARLREFIQTGHDQSVLSGAEKSLRKAAFNSVPERWSTGNIQSGSPLPADIQHLLKSLENEKGTSFLVRLRAFLLSVSNQDLKALTINAKGLSALEALLVDAGFDAEMVNEWMAEWQEMLQEGELTLLECFDKLAGLMDRDALSGLFTDDEKEPADENILAISALPFIETLLTALKVPPEKINIILSDATDPRKGINLDILIDKLQQIQKTTFLSGHSMKTTESESGFQMLLTQLGAQNNHIQSPELTLNDLVKVFETLRQDMKQRHFGTQQAVVNPPAVNFRAVTANMEKPSTEVIKTAGPVYTGASNPLNLSPRHKEETVTALIQNIVIKESKTGNIRENGDSLKTASKADTIIHQMESNLKQESAGTSIFGKSDDPSSYKSLFHKLQASIREKETDVPGKEILSRDLDSIQAKPDSRHRRSPHAGQMAGGDIKPSGSLNEPEKTNGRPAVRNLSDYVAHQVKQSLVRAINQGTSELKIQLKPPEMGRLLITIDYSGNHMKVNIMAENQATRDILLSNINELRTVFSNSGLNLENFEVDLGSNFRQSMADAKSQAGQFGKGHQGRKSVSGITDDENSLQTDENNTSASSVINNRLHYVA